MYKSIVKELGEVQFPEFLGERVYMRKFTKASGLPKDLERWQPTVDSMLNDVDCNGDIFIMIDQTSVQAGNSHRRAGAHIDGYWLEDVQAHGGGGRHSRSLLGHHGDYWGNTSFRDFEEPEGIILASDVEACRAFVGDYQGEIREGGDCEDIDKHNMGIISLKQNTTYAGNVTMIHESLPVSFDCNRTLVRLNVKGWTPH